MNIISHKIINNEVKKNFFIKEYEYDIKVIKEKVPF
jgi:hypothetical protein